MSFGENLGVVTVLSKGGCLAFKCSALYGSLHFSFIVSQDMCSFVQLATKKNCAPGTILILAP